VEHGICPIASVPLPHFSRYIMLWRHSVLPAVGGAHSNNELRSCKRGREGKGGKRRAEGVSPVGL